MSIKLTTIALVLASGAASAATTYWVDAGIEGVGNVSTATGWNNLTGSGDPANLTDIVDSTGGASTVDIAYSQTGPGTDGDASLSGVGGDYTGTYPAAVSPLFPNTALKDGLYFRNSETITLTLSGLDDTMSYDFLLYGARSNAGGDAIYTANGLNTGSGTIANVFENDTDTVSISGINPNGGVITLVLSQAALTANPGALNAFSFTAIPEPSSTALLGLGGLALILRRRK